MLSKQVANSYEQNSEYIEAIKKFKPIILGFRKCGCGTEIEIR